MEDYYGEEFMDDYSLDEYEKEDDIYDEEENSYLEAEESEDLSTEKQYEEEEQEQMTDNDDEQEDLLSQQEYTGEGYDHEEYKEEEEGVGSDALGEVLLDDMSIKDNAELANIQADKIISLGVEDMNEVLDELLLTDCDNTRDSVLKERISGELVLRSGENALRERGEDPSILRDENFISFAGHFRDDIPLMDVYECYVKEVVGREEKPSYSPAGSVKDTKKSGGIKDFYTSDEVDEFTAEDLRRNPRLLDIINRSMERWG
ncbi:hypothetical protein [Anaerofustis sp.]|uniref:hypothetical protein n=1 Tax=Anaerofustis sp. TaxID=1872517 RepID=UPI0025C392D5|nr:hypothetical protein [Anaerofustis sp.]